MKIKVKDIKVYNKTLEQWYTENKLNFWVDDDDFTEVDDNNVNWELIKKNIKKFGKDEEFWNKEVEYYEIEKCNDEVHNFGMNEFLFGSLWIQSFGDRTDDRISLGFRTTYFGEENQEKTLKFIEKADEKAVRTLFIQ